ncbi:MAG: branched-chain amino acid ABC transporter permease [Desulfosarcina sp.]
MSTRNKSLIVLAIAGVFGLLPLGLDDYRLHVLVICLNYAILAASWNLVAGYTGQVSFAHAAFAGVGAYTSGILAVHLGFNPWLGLAIGTAVAGLAGFLIGVLCLQMGGIYLSLTTLGFSQILHIVITNEYEITRGTMGLQVPALMSVYSKTAYFYIMLAALIVTLLIIHRIIYSNTGLNFRAVQNDETAAAALGVNVVRVRVMAFTVSSALAGMAGGLFGHYLLLITPQIPSLDQQFLVLAMTVIGGMGSFIGPVIGAFMLNILAEYIRAYGEYHVLVFGLVALLMARFFPNGVVGLYKGKR